MDAINGVEISIWLNFDYDENNLIKSTCYEKSDVRWPDKQIENKRSSWDQRSTIPLLKVIWLLCNYKLDVEFSIEDSKLCDNIYTSLGHLNRKTEKTVPSLATVFGTRSGDTRLGRLPEIFVGKGAEPRKNLGSIDQGVLPQEQLLIYLPTSTSGNKEDFQAASNDQLSRIVEFWNDEFAKGSGTPFQFELNDESKSEVSYEVKQESEEEGLSTPPQKSRLENPRWNQLVRHRLWIARVFSVTALLVLCLWGAGVFSPTSRVASNEPSTNDSRPKEDLASDSNKPLSDRVAPDDDSSTAAISEGDSLLPAITNSRAESDLDFVTSRFVANDSGHLGLGDWFEKKQFTHRSTSDSRIEEGRLEMALSMPRSMAESGRSGGLRSAASGYLRVANDGRLGLNHSERLEYAEMALDHAERALVASYSEAGPSFHDELPILEIKMNLVTLKSEDFQTIEKLSSEKLEEFLLLVSQFQEAMESCLGLKSEVNMRMGTWEVRTSYLILNQMLGLAASKLEAESRGHKKIQEDSFRQAWDEYVALQKLGESQNRSKLATARLTAVSINTLKHQFFHEDVTLDDKKLIIKNLGTAMRELRTPPSNSSSPNPEDLNLATHCWNVGMGIVMPIVEAEYRSEDFGEVLMQFAEHADFDKLPRKIRQHYGDQIKRLKKAHEDFLQ